MTDLFPTIVSAICTAVVGVAAGWIRSSVRENRRKDEKRDKRLDRLERGMARVELHLQYLREQADPEYRPTLSSLSDPPEDESEPPSD